ncbi:MAG TPA: DNA replication and repair protein RecF [Steroidobacteraceae bacterium]|nr:DNA replication and repair protein RecF [Steroidobacteraceae bacterium]
MPLRELRLQDLRCLPFVEVQLHSGMNLITGENGAGKTTLLEAIYLLGRGRSFRTRHVAQLIRQGQSRCWVAGRVETAPEADQWAEPRVTDRTDHVSIDGAHDKALGGDSGQEAASHAASMRYDVQSVVQAGAHATERTQRQRRVDVSCDGEGVVARIDGQAVDSLVELSRLLPVQAIDPNIHRLVEEGPALRRRWLDWAVFHVEPAFMPQWQGYMRTLRQRNAALRSGWDPVPWETELIRLGEALTAARERVMAELRPVWESTVADMGAVATTLGLARGWSREESLAEALGRHRERDRERGVTGQGPHRCDVVLRIDGRPARDIVSRGQQKVLGAVMALTIMRYLTTRLGAVPMLLLDDPAAELDATHTEALLHLVARLGGQCVATALHPQLLAGPPADRVFHVERGRVKQL